MKRLIVSGCMALCLAGMVSLGTPATHAARLTTTNASELRACMLNGWRTGTT